MSLNLIAINQNRVSIVGNLEPFRIIKDLDNGKIAFNNSMRKDK